MGFRRVIKVSGAGAPRRLRSNRSRIAGSRATRAENQRITRDHEILKHLFEQVPFIITTYDPKLDTFRFNRELTRVLGWTQQDIDEHDLLELAFPDAAARAEAADFMMSMAPGWKEFAVRAKDGSIVPTAWTNLGLSGGIHVGIGLDLRERKRAEESQRASEEKFRSVFEQAAIGMGRASFLDARWIEVNQAFCAMLGYSREEMLRIPWPQMTHPEDIDRDLIPFRRMAAGELSDYTVEKRFIHKQGHYVWARLTLSAVRDAHGRPDYEVAIVEDIDDRKRAERALQAANATLLEEDRRKNAFISVLSHELRNPLAPIRNSLHILDRVAPQGEQARRAREIIDRQFQQMTRLIDDLLDVTRVTRGKVRLQRERLDLCQLVHRTVEDHRATFDTARIGLEIDVCSEPLFIDGDATRLSQIIGNLLSNAKKFTAPGGRVHLSLGHEQNRAVIRVRDNGAGIAPELLQRVFEPFVQADSTLDRSKTGLGLGLALVKGFAELHGGRVTAASEGPGLGTEFTVLLPMAQERVTPLVSGSKVGGSQPAKQPLRILLIEDNVDAANSLKEALELHGHHVEIARTGQEGLDKAGVFHPQFVLCDIGLPGIDGYEVARRMRADPGLGEARLIALSGYAGPEDREKSRKAGFLRHLSKPPDLDALESTMAALESGT